MLGIANVCDMKIFCDLAGFVENNYVEFIVNIGGNKVRSFKRYVRFSKRSKALYVNILGTRIFYEDFK